MAGARGVEPLVAQSLRQETITLGRDSGRKSGRIAWVGEPPLIAPLVSDSDPRLPCFQQLSDVQAFSNVGLATSGFDAPGKVRLSAQRPRAAVFKSLYGCVTFRNAPPSMADSNTSRFGFVSFAETWNGRLAMLGFVIGLGTELLTGQGILGQLGLG